MPGLTDDDSTLKFNVTGNNTIVSELDISYSTPSDGLASILAIGNLSAPTQVDDLLAGTLNYLNLLNRPGKGSKFNPTLIKSLPIKGEVSADSLDLTGAIDVNSFLQTANNSVSSEKELTSGESQPNVEESTDVNLSKKMKGSKSWPS